MTSARRNIAPHNRRSNRHCSAKLKSYPPALLKFSKRKRTYPFEQGKPKMKRAVILMCAVFPALTACGGLKGGGEGLQIRDLPPAAQQKCQPPASFLNAGDWEIIAGRIGDELIKCENRRDLAVQAYQGVKAAAGGDR